jgi:outer membrane protein OmpA-like peptidoglycan-associated protein
MWLEQIANQAGGSRACMRIVGHSSYTGTPEFNEQLSKGRAERVGELLQRTVPQLSGRLTTSGMGFRENLVGSGTDDSRDALDRRVEFKFDDC